MKVKVKNPEGKTKTLNLKDGAKARDAALALKINPEMVLIKKRDKIIPDVETLKDKDEIELLKVVSGG